VTAGGERLAQLLRASDAATTARPMLWDSAWRMIRDHPIFGVGPDNFLYQYPAYIRPEAWAEPNISHSHNLVLDTWLTVGVLGLVVLAVFAAAYAQTWRSALENATTQDQALVYGLGGTMVATVVHGMVDASIFLPELAATFWVVTAATVIMVRTRVLSESDGDEQ
jgi:O-antigen ligase